MFAKKYENQMNMSSEKHQILENQLNDKEKTINENSKLLINYQIEVCAVFSIFRFFFNYF